MRTIRVNIPDHPYDIHIERGLLKNIGEISRRLTKAVTVAVISDSRVDAIYGDAVEQSLRQEGFQVGRIVFPEGEVNKTLSTLQRVYEELAQLGITRTDVIITLGGGVPGDLGGMAAATYLRGVPFIQVPTTVLAQIDSSVGGKVAVDLETGKNMVGSFYHPIGVIIDPNVLGTLDQRYVQDGLAEAVKYGCIADEALFEQFEQWKDTDEILSNAEALISRCCEIKALIVEEDPLDTGRRMILNFGHTLGHAIEAKYKYSVYTHGEGVALGMMLITARTEELGSTAKGTVQRLKAVLDKIGLPTTIKETPSELLEGVSHDKKRMGKDMTFVVIPKIGVSELVRMPYAEVAKYISGEGHSV